MATSLPGDDLHGRASSALRRQEDAWVATIARCWLLLCWAVVLLTFRDYGITWDEDWHISYGRHIRMWYGSFFQDTGALTYRADYLYGGAYDVLAAVAADLFRRDKHHAVHLLNAHVGLLGLIGTWRLGRESFGAKAGLVALLLCSLTGVYWGAMFNNPKDLPFAVGYVWALHGMAWLLPRIQTATRTQWAWAGALLGGASCVRIAGLLVFCYFAVALVLMALGRAFLTRDRERFLEELADLAPKGLLALASGWVVMIVAWPWAQLDPLGRPLIALSRMSYFNQHVRTMPFAGRTIWTYDVQPDYLAHYFVFQLPEVVLLLLALALLAAPLVVLVTYKRPELLARNVVLVVLVMALVVPPAYAIIKRSILYDGMRHFLFLVPVMSVSAAGAYALMVHALGRLEKSWTLVLHAMLSMALAAEAFHLVSLHPYQTASFNRVIGGLPGAYLQYDTDYYGNSFREAYANLIAKLWRDERARYLNGDIVVTGCIPESIGKRYLPPNFHWKIRKIGSAAFYAGYTRGNCHEQFPTAREYGRVEREGALLNIVKDLRPDGELDSLGHLFNVQQARDDLDTAPQDLGADAKAAPLQRERPPAPAGSAAAPRGSAAEQEPAADVTADEDVP